MSETRAEKIESKVVSLGLVMLIALPCSFDLLVMGFFDGPGVGDITAPISYGLRAVCSAASALGVARLCALRGWARLAVVALLGAALFAISWFVTFFVAALLFMPRH